MQSKKIKQLLVLTVFILTSAISKAQLDDFTNRQIVELDKLLASPITYVILNDSSPSFYNDAIKYAVNRHWKINKVEYITKAEYDKYDKNKPFDAPYIMDRIQNESFSSVSIYREYIGLYYNDEKNRYSSFDTYCIESSREKFPMKTLAVKAVKEFVRWVNYYKTVKSTGKKPEESLTHEETQKRIRKSTLVISEKDLGDDVQNMAQIKAIYPDKVKIVTDEELFKYIDAVEPVESDMLIVDASRPSRDFKKYRKEVKEHDEGGGTKRYIMDPNTSEELYTYDRPYKSSATVGFTGDDFEMIMKPKLNAYSKVHFSPF